MSTHLSIELSDDAFALLSDEASAIGKTPSELVTEIVEQQFNLAHPQQAGSVRLERSFGSVDLGHPIGVSNEEIDADIAAHLLNRKGLLADRDAS